jgi:quinol monooxygenase YgiN
VIIVIARVEADPARLEELKPALVEMMRASWAESGCLSYSLSVEDAAAGIIIATERWASEADLRAHFASPHMAKFNAAISGAVRSMDAKMYDASNERPLAV